MRAFIVGAALLGACASTPSDIELTPPCHGKCDAPAGVRDRDGDGVSMCLAVRGNGPRITAHFGAIARVFEQFGLADGVAGGSSGSITAFLVESVEMNPAIYRCGNRGCTAREAGERAAFLFKSLREYFDVLAESDEALALTEVADLAREIRANNIESMLAGGTPQAGVDALRVLLASSELRGIINPELATLLQSSPDPLFHARDLAASLSKGLAFEATDPTIFLRPGALNFATFVDRVGRIGTFYAGRGPADTAAMAELLDGCATEARGKTWAQAAAVPYDGATCGERFRSMLEAFRAEVIANPGAHSTRLDDFVGGAVPALVTTGVLENGGAAAWRTARASYLAGRPTPLVVDFDDVGIGYFGTAGDLDLITAVSRTDIKSRMRTSLGASTWRAALLVSPAEPGLSRGLELPDGRVSVGGWSDLQPMLVLQDLGCDKIVYVSRQGGAGDFERGITRLLGITAMQADELYSLGDATSSLYQSVARADGVVCADWDAPPVTDLDAMTAIGYDAPFETDDPFFTAHRYPAMVARTGLPGCTLGVE